MQAKGLIKFFSIALFLVCLFQLSFTYKTYQIEKRADAYARQVTATYEPGLAELKQSKPAAYFDTIKVLEKTYRQQFLDSISNLTVYNLFIAKYTYNKVKDNQLKLGLDLKGGMSVVLEVSIEDLLVGLEGQNKDMPVFR